MTSPASSNTTEPTPTTRAAPNAGTQSNSARQSGDTPPPAGLDALAARLAQDLRWLALPAASWVPPRFVDGERVRDVVIVGGGMAGLTLSAELQFLGIDNRQTYDRAANGHEGPWVDFARMRTLRSPKVLTGPALRLPALTFRAWFEAQFGLPAWEALNKIPREQWMDYLRWYRDVLQLPVDNGVALRRIQPRGDGLVALTFERVLPTAASTETAVSENDAVTAAPSVDTTQVGRVWTVLTRHVVLASGRDGLGGPSVPPIADSLPRARWAHSADAIDFKALSGKRVAVIGAGASAFDNAATALEAGAASVDMVIRRADIPRVNALTGIGSPGLAYGFTALESEWKWRFLHYAGKVQTPPPRDSVLRVSRFPNARFRVGSAVLSMHDTEDGVRIETARGALDVDFVIFGTGFHSRMSARPELADIAPYVRLWQDRFTPDAGEKDSELAESPDLADDFSFQEKVPGSCPGLSRIHCFNFAASLSAGKVSGDIPAISIGAQRLAQHLVSRLFQDDQDTHYATLQAYDVPELQGDEWQPYLAPTSPDAFDHASSGDHVHADGGQ
ncbi:NAD(P)/FAD-dependent oxidoreductase [Robbsia sp. KACC 23696]|uniref:NAD(P)/FAD-dependent oxidoreductase n=1 Tax=Robbsia sp. KACC 23696 TaxID=3149231 RepID=UPI00325B97D9